MDNLNQFEAVILLWVQNNLRTDTLNAVMPYLSMINNAGILAIFTVVVLLLWKRYRYTGVTAAVSLAIEALVVNILLKNIVARVRPYIVNKMLIVLGSVPVDYSFPSGHTGSIFAVSSVIFICMPRKYGVPAVILSVLIALSRIYNAAHYPTDVLCGMIVGILTGISASKLVHTRLTK